MHVHDDEDYNALPPEGRSEMDVQMRMLLSGMDTNSSQRTTENFLDGIKEVLPSVALSLLQHINTTHGLALTAEDLPVDFFEWHDTQYREILKKVLGDVAPKHVTVYFCPSPTCDGSRHSDKHDEACGKCGLASYTFVDPHGQKAVCTLHYYPMATLIRLMFADPIKAQHLRGTYHDYEAHPDEMTGMYGEFGRPMVHVFIL